MILYIEDAKDSSRKLLKPINEFGKVAGYKTNTQKSVAVLYINNERSETEIQKAIPFTIESKIIKYLRINLHKKKDMYSESYKILMKEIEEYINKWKDIPCSWIRRINIVKMTRLFKISYNSVQSLSNYKWHFSQKKKLSKFVWRYKRP